MRARRDKCDCAKRAKKTVVAGRLQDHQTEGVDDARFSLAAAPRIGPLTRLLATFIAWFVYALIWLLGRKRNWRDATWLAGPLGGESIGDAPYADVAEREGLEVVRGAPSGGLIPEFDALRGADFDPAQINPLVRDFYEHTAEFAMDVWSKAYFPGNIFLALLVKTISRQVNQLNFPLSPLEAALGISSEIVLLRNSDGTVRYTGWYRTLAQSNLVLYTGFYMTERVPGASGPFVKVVFPMPHGNATVLLRPIAEQDGSLILASGGERFGDAGFFRLDSRDEACKDGTVRVWYIRSLKERFRVFVDGHGNLRCDHTIAFLRFPVVALHYKIYRASASRRLTGKLPAVRPMI